MSFQNREQTTMADNSSNNENAIVSSDDGSYVEEIVTTTDDDEYIEEEVVTDDEFVEEIIEEEVLEEEEENPVAEPAELPEQGEAEVITTTEEIVTEEEEATKINVAATQIGEENIPSVERGNNATGPDEEVVQTESPALEPEAETVTHAEASPAKQNTVEIVSEDYTSENFTEDKETTVLVQTDAVEAESPPPTTFETSPELPASADKAVETIASTEDAATELNAEAEDAKETTKELAIEEVSAYSSYTQSSSDKPQSSPPSSPKKLKIPGVFSNTVASSAQVKSSSLTPTAAGPRKKLNIPTAFAAAPALAATSKSTTPAVEAKKKATEDLKKAKEEAEAKVRAEEEAEIRKMEEMVAAKRAELEEYERKDREEKEKEEEKAKIKEEKRRLREEIAKIDERIVDVKRAIVLSPKAAAKALVANNFEIPDAPDISAEGVTDDHKEDAVGSAFLPADEGEIASTPVTVEVQEDLPCDEVTVEEAAEDSDLVEDMVETPAPVDLPAPSLADPPTVEDMVPPEAPNALSVQTEENLVDEEPAVKAHAAVSDENAPPTEKAPLSEAKTPPVTPTVSPRSIEEEAQAQASTNCGCVIL